MTLDVHFQFVSQWVFNNRESFQAVFCQIYCLVLRLTFVLIIWAICSTYLTLDRRNPGIGLIHFVKKTIIVLHYLNG